VLSHGPLAESG